MTGEFEGKVAVITGAARGIGRAIAEDLHRRGAGVVLVDRSPAVAELAECLHQQTSTPAAHALIADLSDPVAIEQLARRIAALAPEVHILVNNAGIEADQPFAGITAEMFDYVIAVNLRAPLLLSQALASLFPASGGAIVNISSIHADHAFPHAIPYACSKAGLVALTRNMALELAPRRIRVNAVCPGYIDTPMWEEWLRTMDDPQAVAGQTQPRVDIPLHADHQREGLPMIPPMRHDGMLDELRGLGVRGKSEFRGERNHAVLGVDFLRPVGEKAPHFAEGLAAKVGIHVVAPGAQLGHRVRPIEEQRVDPQGRDEAGVARKALLPHRALEVVEG